MREDLGDHMGSLMAAMIFKVPPHWEHCSITQRSIGTLPLAKKGVCNSYPHPECLCAEAVALAHLVMAGGRCVIAAAVAGVAPEPITACGGCRQKLREFAEDDATVVGADMEAVRLTTTLGGIGKINAIFRRKEQYCWASELSNILGLESGTFRAIHRPEVPSFGVFCRLGRMRCKGDCRLGEMNRTEGDIGFGSGYLESIELPRRGSGWCSSGQAEMREDLGDHDGIFDGGDDLQGSAALGTLFNIDIESQAHG